MPKGPQCIRQHAMSGFPDPATTVPSHLTGVVVVVSDRDGVILVFPDTPDLQSPAVTRAAATCRCPLHNH
jgi:hypothetical protein